MFGPIPVISAGADEGGPLAYGKSALVARNLQLESLTWENNGADAAFIQIFNTPRAIGAIAITDTVAATGVMTVASGALTAAGYVTGDKVTLSGIATLTTGYINLVSATTFKLYSTRALALAGGTADLLPDADDDTGTVYLASLAASEPVPEEYPVLGVASAPANIGSYTNVKFTRGMYVRAVTAAGGSTLIAGNDIKFTPRYSSGPIMGITYED